MSARIKRLSLGVLIAVALNLALATLTASGKSKESEKQLERDRQAILAMAGTFRVTFDMRETVPFVADYQPIAPKTSRANEVVKVIENSGGSISLQHLLVADDDSGEPQVIKHWRQSWVFEPKEILVYAGANQWRMKPLTFVHEVVVNTYVRTTDFYVAAADRYWDKTQDYWAAVRSDWESVIHRNRGIRVEEEAENGSKTGPLLMTLASRLASGEIETAEAAALAKREIATAVQSRTADVPARL